MPINPFDDATGEDLTTWLTVNGQPKAKVTRGVVTAGNSLATATPLNIGWSIVETAVGGEGVRLPDVSIGSSIIVVNNTAAAGISIYPNSIAESFIGSSPGDPASQSGYTLGTYYKIDETSWFAY